MPTVGVNDGASLAGNESADASCTRSSDAPRRAFEYVGEPPARSGEIALAGQRPPDEASAEAGEKRAGDAAAPQPFDGQRAAADADEPSRHREFARAVPAPAIPDAGAVGAMGREVEVLRRSCRCFD